VFFETFFVHRLGITGVFFFFEFVLYWGLTFAFILALHVVGCLVSGIPVASLEFIHLHLFPLCFGVLGFLCSLTARHTIFLC